MTATRRRTLAVLAAGVAAIALTGCGGDSKVTETRDGRVTVSGKGNKTTATVEGDGSSVVYGVGAVPEGFPSAVPLPQAAKLGTTAAGTRGDTRFFQLTYLPATTGAKALAAYRAQLSAGGFTVTDGAGASIDATDGTWTVRATAGAGDPATLALSVTNA